MEYMSSKQAAEKWDVTVRWVQVCCKNGQIEGAMRLGKEWMIPAQKDKSDIKPMGSSTIAIPMRLLGSSFELGHCKEYVNCIEHADERAIAMAEYYYFTAQAEKASCLALPYLQSKDKAIMLSACLIYCFSNLSLGYIQLAQRGLDTLKECIEEDKEEHLSPVVHAIKIFITNAACVLLHLPISEVPDIETILPLMPKGLRFFGCYIMAHKAYLRGDYTKALGIAQATIAMSDELYPIGMIYMKLVVSMSLISLKRSEEAKVAFMQAWEIAKKDDLIEAFGEHHGLLGGMVEACLKNNEPKSYESIINITYHFSAGWRKIHNPNTAESVADNLSTMEFSIAMLANRGWTNREIAQHLRLSEHTVKNNMSVIYQKLNINSRKDLRKYMLR